MKELAITNKEIITLHNLMHSGIYENIRRYLRHLETEDHMLDDLVNILSVAMNKKLLGTGSFRGVFKLSEKLCFKLTISGEDHEYMNYKELILNNYVRREAKDLVKFLCPIVARIDDINILPICEIGDNVVTREEIRAVKRLFYKNGIVIEDLRGPSQFGRLNGQLVILDYEKWNFLWRVNLKEYAYKHKDNKEGNRIVWR